MKVGFKLFQEDKERNFVAGVSFLEQSKHKSTFDGDVIPPNFIDAETHQVFILFYSF